MLDAYIFKFFVKLWIQMKDRIYIYCHLICLTYSSLIFSGTYHKESDFVEQ